MLATQASDRCAGSNLRSDETQFCIIIAGKFQHMINCGERDATGRRNLIQAAVTIPYQQIVILEPSQYGVELDRVNISETCLQFARRPLRSIAACADFTQHEQARHNSILAAMKQ